MTTRNESRAELTNRAESCSTALVPVDSSVPQTWSGRIAYGISQVGSPPVLASSTMALSASTVASPGAWRWAGVYVLLAILTPLFYLIRLARRGQVTDLDVQLREQRMRPMVFTLACTGVAWLALVLGAAPPRMVALAGTLWLQALVIFGITLRWKISVHCATAAAAGTVVWSLVGNPLSLLIGVPLVAWSRVRLRRHTLAQTVGGTLLGVAIFLTTFALAHV